MVAAPNLTDLCALIEEFPKPVVAALNGTTLGGGLELALVCHYRVAVAPAQLGLPEVKLGLLPGAGGTQRLPRLVGAERALNMIVSGNPVAARELAATNLLDLVVEADAVTAAIAFAQRNPDGGLPLKKARDSTVAFANAEAFFDFARGAIAPIARNYPAPAKCIDAVEAAVLKPFDEGMKLERAAFTELLATTESKALRHVFFATRAAPKVPDVPVSTPLRPIKSVAVIGAGTMGGGIAMNFANAGLPVTVLETTQAALDKGLGVVKRNYESTLKKGRLSPEEFDNRLGRIKGTLSYDDVSQADLIIEAVFEDLPVKKQVFETLDGKAKAGAILASNTSTLDLNKIADFTRRPQDVVGLHFFSPANVTRLLEIVRGAKTAKDVIATSLGIAKQIKKIGVVAGVCDGFIGNRMLNAYFRQMGLLLDLGALPQQVDRALEKFGFAMGPFRVSDLAGNDIGWAIRKRLYIEHPDVVHSKTADRICELGRFGQKTGAGWYDYKPGDRTPMPSDLVTDDHRGGIGAAGTRPAQGERPGNRRARAVLADQRRRAHPRGGDRAARLGHRCGLHRRVWVSRLPRRSDVLRRHDRPAEYPAHHASIRQGLSARRVGTGALVEDACRREPNVRQLGNSSMTDAVVVSTARTGLAKSWRGALNMTHPVTFTGHVLRQAIERARIDPAEVEDVIVGATFLEGAAGANVARQVGLRAGCPVTTSGLSINRFCSSGLQSIALAAQRILSGEGQIYAAGGLESISCIQNQANLRMLKEQWVVEHKPEVYWSMLQTAETVAKRYGIGRQAQDEYGVRSQLRASAAARAGRFKDEIVPLTTSMAVADKDAGTIATREVILDSDEGIRPDTTYEGVAKIRPALAGRRDRRG